MPDTVNCILDLHGQVSTNAGKIAIIPKTGMRQLAAAAIGLAIRTGVYINETSALSLPDRAHVTANAWNPMKVVNNNMANNRDLVTSIMKDL